MEGGVLVYSCILVVLYKLKNAIFNLKLRYTYNMYSRYKLQVCSQYSKAVYNRMSHPTSHLSQLSTIPRYSKRVIPTCIGYRYTRFPQITL